MGFFTSHEFRTLDDLLINQLQDLYDAEQQISDALPKMERAATHPQLKSAFREHLGQTQQHVTRLDRVIGMMGPDSERETCQAMKGIIREGEDAVDAGGDPSVKDAALIAAAQRVEHYEIAVYGTARTFARQLGRDEIADILQQTLDEEKQTDQKLTKIAESSVNIEAP